MYQFAIVALLALAVVKLVDFIDGAIPALSGFRSLLNFVFGIASVSTEGSRGAVSANTWLAGPAKTTLMRDPGRSDRGLERGGFVSACLFREGQRQLD